MFPICNGAWKILINAFYWRVDGSQPHATEKPCQRLQMGVRGRAEFCSRSAAEADAAAMETSFLRNAEPARPVSRLPRGCCLQARCLCECLPCRTLGPGSPALINTCHGSLSPACMKGHLTNKATRTSSIRDLFHKAGFPA